jgi:hypothetical protein
MKSRLVRMPTGEQIPVDLNADRWHGVSDQKAANQPWNFNKDGILFLLYIVFIFNHFNLEGRVEGPIGAHAPNSKPSSTKSTNPLPKTFTLPSPFTVTAQREREQLSEQRDAQVDVHDRLQRSET